MAFGGSTYLGNSLYYLERLGIVDIIIPFILIFTLVFAVLEKTKILGKEKKNFNVIIAMAIALSVIIPHATNSYPQGTDVVNIINQALPGIALVLIALLCLFVLIGSFGATSAWKGPLTTFVMITAFVLVIVIFGSAANIVDIPRFFDDPELQALIIFIVIFGLIVFFISGGGTKDDKPALGEFFKLKED